MQGLKLTLVFLVLSLIAGCAEKTIRIGAPAATGIAGREDIPLLELDTGGHHDRMRGLLFTPDGKQVISAGYDKVIRIWDIDSGSTSGILRGQIKAGQEGILNTIALSPDGRWLAAAGLIPGPGSGALKERFGGIRLYDLPRQRLGAVLPDQFEELSSAVNSVAFSPDGNLLTSSDAFGLTFVWDMPQKKYLGAMHPGLDMSVMDWVGTITSPQETINNKLLPKRVISSAFTPDGKRLVTAHQDAKLRLWDIAHRKLLATLSGHAAQVNAVVVSPTDGMIASGSMDHTIRLWDGETGQPLKILADQGAAVAWLSFSPDGRYLLSTEVDFAGEHALSHVWSVPDGKQLVTYDGHENAFGVIGAISPDGRLAATAGGADNNIDLWSIESGALVQRLAGSGSGINRVGFSADGGAMVWSTRQQFDKASQTSREYQRMKLPQQAADQLGEPRRLPGDMDIGNQRERLSQGRQTLRTRKGGPLNLDLAILEAVEGDSVNWTVERGPLEGFYHSAVTFTPDGRQVISGGANGTLTAYNASGKVAGHFVGHTGLVKSVAVSPDGKLLVSGAQDQTVKLWNLETFELLLTVFYDKHDRWVAWTPSGHYIASPDERADRFFGWHVNRGPDHDADFVTARQLRKQLYRPDIVNDAVRLRSVEQALQKAGDTGFKLTELNRALPPSFTVRSPSNQAEVREDSVAVVLDFAANPEPLLDIDANVNGSKVHGRMEESGQPPVRQLTLRIPLQSGENTIKITASNRIGESAAQTLTVRQLGLSTAHEENTLYLLAVGVNQFEHHDPGLVDLSFAVADAKAVHDILGTQAGKAYSQVKPLLLTDGAQLPTKANIENVLSTLSKVKPQDTVVVFLAGHGVNEGSDYYFLPRDARSVNGKLDTSTGIGWKFLQQTLANTAGRRILLVDTCHSGNAFNPRLVKDTADGNILLISATDSQSLSQESSAWGHGAFTYALLQGLEGRADSNPDGLIKIKELDSYISDKVEELTDSKQLPILATPGIFKNFVFAKL